MMGRSTEWAIILASLRTWRQKQLWRHSRLDGTVIEYETRRANKLVDIRACLVEMKPLTFLL